MSADFVIVGGGSAGCVLADRLSADPSCRVVLVEAGGTGTSFLVSMPAGYGKTTGEFGHSWHYHSAVEDSIDQRRMLLPRGRGLGGSSNINGLLYVRGQHADYDTWSNLGALGWGWSDVAPYFRRSETYAGGGDALRGDSGGLRVEEVSHRDATNDAVLAGFRELGVPMARDYNGADQYGAFYYQTTIHEGKRCSAADAFLRPAMRRPNLRVITGAHCRRVLFDGRRATGIEIETRRGVETIAAAREVLLSAGAYHSPKLLMLSGIGPAAHLQAMGIPVLHDSPDVGENLQDHYILTMSWRLRSRSYSYNRELGGARLLWNVLRYAATRKGPMTIPVAQTGAFVKSDPALQAPDIQFHCLPVTGDLDQVMDGGKATLSNFPGLTLGPNVLRPESRGRLRLASPDAQAVPDIVHNYLEAEADRRLSLRAMRMARELVATRALGALVDAETWPGSQCTTDDELLGYARQFGNTGYHPVGTCRMGIDTRAVLDPQLRVNGVIGLRVIDASVMPRLVSGNTNAPAIMIGEKGADMIAGGH
ncbi:MAG: GMC family oxidoreductase N-terminal domain-containing protein [Sphingomonadales bacterium]|nr:GMC family oxidoreductase N-terminal domain-containing protein [Sphingomonadales bacterium]